MKLSQLKQIIKEEVQKQAGMRKEQFNEQAQDFIKHLQSFQEYLGSLSEDFVEEVSVNINGMEEELKDIIFEVENQIEDEE